MLQAVESWRQSVSIHSAKLASNRAVYHSKSEAEKVALQKIDLKSADVYRLAKQISGCHRRETCKK